MWSIMAKLSDLVIMSDVDGTLLKMPGGIPKRNVEALERFVEKGGRFAIATGRSETFTRPLIAQLPVNFPCVVFNGGALYDFKKGEYLMQLFLPANARDYYAKIMEAFPHCGPILVTDSEYYDIDGRAMRYFKDRYPNSTMLSAQLDDVPEPIYKGLIVHAPEITADLKAFAAEQGFTGVRLVDTNPYLLEMLPEKSSKGYALEQLISLTGIAQENLVAIGDYYNDREMLEFAGISATMHSSPEDLKALADILVCECEDGALADLVEQLEARFE